MIELRDKTLEEWAREAQELRGRLEAAEETLRAIQSTVLTQEGAGSGHSEAMTRAALDRLYLALSSTTFGVLLVNEDGRIDFANQAFCDIFDLKEDPAELKSLTSPEMLEKIRHAYENPDEALAHIVEIVGRGQLVQGEEVPMSRERVFLRDYIPIGLGGADYGRLWIHKDITDRKRAEAALREREATLSGILDAVKESIWLLNADGRVLLANATAIQRMGKPASDIVGKLTQDILSPELAAARLARYQQVIGSRQPLEFEDERAGIAFRHSFYPVFDFEGHVSAVASFSRDITERKRVERALALSAWQKSLLASASAQVVAQNTSQGVLTVAAKLARELTQARFALSGRGCPGGDFHADATSLGEGATPWLPSHVLAGNLYEELISLGDSIRVNGDQFGNYPAWRGLIGEQERLHGLLATRLVDAQGNAAGLIMVGHKNDGGEFTEDDEALLRQLAVTASLALQHIEARTQAQERSDALIEDDRHKDEFLAMLAHELRNPLAPIRNAVHVLHFAGGSEPILQRQRDIIERQVTHMAHLLDDLLDVSRITRGKIVLKREPVHLTDVLVHAIETTAPVVESRRHVLTVTMPPDDLRVDGDADRLVQMIGNLLVNAAKYTDEGGQIWLEAVREGEEAVIRVRDTGLGIDPSMLPRVFDLFAQGDHSLARTQGGLGIGLTMVKYLAAMHGGQVEARSSGCGHGSEFIIRLPYLADETLAQVAIAAQDAVIPETSSHRILVVDDMEDARTSLAELLELLGNEVRTTANGPAALESARTWRPEVVLLDIGLPGMDGLEVARCLRAEHGDSMLLIALTGYAQQSDRQRTRKAGFNHHLGKPVNINTLRLLLTTPH